MSSRSAFSLVELSFVIAIVALLTVGGLSVGVSVIDQKRHVDTKAQLEEIVQALKGFYRVNGRLPCPANRLLTVSDANFGQEADTAANCATDAGVPTGTRRKTASGASHFMRIGALPVRALGLKDSMMHDQWFNNFSYAVAGEATDSATIGTLLTALDGGDTAIEMETPGGASIYDKALYVVISHGMDGSGGRRYKVGTSVQKSCPSGGSVQADSENCEHEISGAATDKIFVDSAFSDSNTAANYYDDYVAWGSQYRLKSSDEQDPQVGDVSTDGNFCRAMSGEIVCDVGGIGLGIGQSWTDVTGSRACGTNYTNSTGSPIQAIVAVDAGHGSGPLSTVGGTSFLFMRGFGASTNMAGSFIVPNGDTYNVSCTNFGTLTAWTELR